MEFDRCLDGLISSYRAGWGYKKIFTFNVVAKMESFSKKKIEKRKESVFSCKMENILS